MTPGELSRSMHPARAGPSGELVRCGAELVELAERFYLRIFTLRLDLTLTAAVVAALAVPLIRPEHTRRTLVAVVVVGAVAGALRASPDRAYLALRRRPTWIVAGAGALAILVAAVGSVHSSLWLVAVGMLFVPAACGGARRSIACGGILGIGILVGALTSGQLHIDYFMPATQAAGAVIWSGFLSAVLDLLARFLLRLRQATQAPPTGDPPRRASATDTPPVWAPASLPAPRGGEPQAAFRDPARRLTARQIEVLVLIRDGLRHADIAACLGISERQVERHVRGAKARLAVGTSAELVAVAVAARLVPR